MGVTRTPLLISTSYTGRDGGTLYVNKRGNEKLRMFGMKKLLLGLGLIISTGLYADSGKDFLNALEFIAPRYAHEGYSRHFSGVAKKSTYHGRLNRSLADAGMIPLGEAEKLEMISRMEELPVLTADDLK